MKNKGIISLFIETMLNRNTSPKNENNFSDKLYSKDFILNQEKEFWVNSYMGSSKEDYKYISGDIPILISAPHSVKQLRNGEYKSADIYTGAIIKTLGKTTNAHIIYKTRTKGDENYTTEKTAYREKIKKIVKENNIKVVIDLHGMSIDKKSAIDMGTGGSNNKNLLGQEYILSSVRKSLKYFNYSENKYFSGGSKLTMSTYCSEILGVPTLQLEINRKYRSKDSKYFSYIVNTLSKVINNLNKEF